VGKIVRLGYLDGDAQSTPDATIDPTGPAACRYGDR
jgi:hypothetical protein